MFIAWFRFRDIVFSFLCPSTWRIFVEWICWEKSKPSAITLAYYLHISGFVSEPVLTHFLCFRGKKCRDVFSVPSCVVDPISYCLARNLSVSFISFSLLVLYLCKTRSIFPENKNSLSYIPLIVFARSWSLSFSVSLPYLLPWTNPRTI